MGKRRFFTLLGLLVVLGLTTGCYRSATDPVTPTSAAGAQAVEPGGGGQEPPEDVEATAMVNTEIATQDAVLAQPTATAVPTAPPPPPTLTPTVPPATVPSTAVPTVASGGAAPTPQPSAPTAQTTHVVQRGENLFRIAQRYGTTVQAIASANGIANPSLVYVGQKLVIPGGSGSAPAPSTGGTTYVVQPGDNLFRIALRYNLSYIYLAQHNGISNPSSIYVGQVLRIPPH